MNRLDDINSAAGRALGTCSLNSAGLAINAGGAATFKTTATLNYAIDGVFYSKAAFTAQAFPATTYTVKQGYAAFFLVYVNAAGTVGVAQGVPFAQETDPADGVTKNRAYRVVPSNLPGGASTIEKGGYLRLHNSPLIPDLPAGCAPVGVIKVTANSADFVPGTTALDNAGLTVTYTNLSYIPANSIL